KFLYSFSISSTRSLSTLESKLDSLQCHFTWGLDTSRSKLLHVRDNLEDIGTQEGYIWLGHIYNLQGFIYCQLGLTEDACRFFSRATEAFRQIRNTVSDEGQWLVVSYGNLAWLHHQLGERAQSQGYISKVDALIIEYASPFPNELHPEIYAEKAWTLMKFGKDSNLLAADYFQRAIRMQPGMVEWQTSHVIALVNAYSHHDKNLGADIFEKLKLTKEQDQANLFLAALYLEACADKGINIENEARELARMVLRKPIGSYSGLQPLLRLYRRYVSTDEAVDLAEEAVERHPDKRYLKKCAATCYKWRILSQKDNPLEHSMINRAISLCKEVISLYPHSSFKMQVTLAGIYAKSNTTQAAADQIYVELLQSDLDPKETQILYNYYAKYLHFNRKEIYKSIEFHMKAAAIPQQSSYRDNSIRNLEKIRERNKNKMCGEIHDFLDKLHH
ncbi:interferon-induced protein with tetratricopeptide repeats 2-like, partial [Acanthochromis polyacanthus]|uniref:interferon-induced protein with tetratricopeptide repeats 2-like n=1 Tax=Acanthochromis polyacanthus TaxID=80966 RepID=UPI00223405CC